MRTDVRETDRDVMERTNGDARMPTPSMLAPDRPRVTEEHMTREDSNWPQTGEGVLAWELTAKQCSHAGIPTHINVAEFTQSITLRSSSILEASRIHRSFNWADGTWDFAGCLRLSQASWMLRLSRGTSGP